MRPAGVLSIALSMLAIGITVTQFPGCAPDPTDAGREMVDRSRGQPNYVVTVFPPGGDTKIYVTRTTPGQAISRYGYLFEVNGRDVAVSGTVIYEPEK